MESPLLPKQIEKPKAPPLKCQGIKTKLVPFITRTLLWRGAGRWIEPFLGSGAVLFNIAPPRAMCLDSNTHVIRFYRDIQSGTIDDRRVTEYLEEEGEKLRRHGAEHYYAVREAFNDHGGSLRFLFLNRACFNGMMRFNAAGGYNVPFGKKPERFRPAYITKIANQVAAVSALIRNRDWIFETGDYATAIETASEEDFVYMDPPYIGRHTDYYNSWNDDDALRLAATARGIPGGFALSMWHSNKYRRNDHIAQAWPDTTVHTANHFYHVGSTTSLRNAVVEALVVKPGYSARY